MDMTDIATAVARLEAKVDQTFHAVQKINGRILDLEQWRREKEKHDAFLKGVHEASAGVILKKSHIALIAAIVGAVAAAVEAIVRYI